MKLKKASLTLLATIVAAGPNGTFADIEALTELVKAKMVETNAQVTNDEGQVAVRATEAGVIEINGAAAAEQSEVPGIVFASVEIPLPAKQRGAGTGRESKYPFEKMAVGNSFFIPCATAEEQANLFKTLGSTASSANRRFATKTGEMVEKRGKQVEKLEYTRYFDVRRVEDGAPWGEQFKGKFGVGCWRTQ